MFLYLDPKEQAWLRPGADGQAPPRGAGAQPPRRRQDRRQQTLHLLQQVHRELLIVSLRRWIQSFLQSREA